MTGWAAVPENDYVSDGDRLVFERPLRVQRPSEPGLECGGQPMLRPGGRLSGGVRT